MVRSQLALTMAGLLHIALTQRWVACGCNMGSGQHCKVGPIYLAGLYSVGPVLERYLVGVAPSTISSPPSSHIILCCVQHHQSVQHGCMLSPLLLSSYCGPLRDALQPHPVLPAAHPEEDTHALLIHARCCPPRGRHPHTADSRPLLPTQRKTPPHC